jgi:hypothetical protein
VTWFCCYDSRVLPTALVYAVLWRVLAILEGRVANGVDQRVLVAVHRYFMDLHSGCVPGPLAPMMPADVQRKVMEFLACPSSLGLDAKKFYTAITNLA